MPTPARRLTLAVVIPTLNEEARIDTRLRELSSMEGIDEIIVVDGGSHDRTLRLARRHEGVRVLESPPGRARQMNVGAAEARSDALLFLHADVSLPADASRWVQSTLLSKEAIAGAFRTWTMADQLRGDTSKPWFSPLFHLADIRSRYSALPYGDQALFLRAQTFRVLGGFPELPLMEDLAFSQRLCQEGSIYTVPASVKVSGRRFQDRPVYYSLLLNALPLLFRLGVPPERLAALYGSPR